jgi:hypothetical protein
MAVALHAAFPDDSPKGLWSSEARGPSRTVAQQIVRAAIHPVSLSSYTQMLTFGAFLKAPDPPFLILKNCFLSITSR